MLIYLFNKQKLKMETNGTQQEIENDTIETLQKENEYLIAMNDYYQLKLKEEKEDIDDHIFLGKHIHTRNDDVKYYVAKTRQFIPNIVPWQYNRSLNLEHVNELKELIINNVVLEGNIDVLECDGDLCVVNGQHRVEAMKGITENDSTFNTEITVYVHPVDSFESDKANEIFNATNNIKNVEMRDRPQKKLQNICTKLKNNFKDSITKNKTGRANLHRMDIKQLYNLMQYNDYFMDEKNNEDKLFNDIIQMNKEFANMSFEQLFGTKRKKNISEKKRKIYEGAINDNFYLGIKSDTQMAIEFQNRFNS